MTEKYKQSRDMDTLRETATSNMSKEDKEQRIREVLENRPWWKDAVPEEGEDNPIYKAGMVIGLTLTVLIPLILVVVLLWLLGVI